MPACAYCGDVADVRLFENRSDRETVRQWSCWSCAWERREGGLQLDLAPEWIERATLRRLPSKDLGLMLSGRPERERRQTADRRERAAT
jgi:hypothetical protein